MTLGIEREGLAEPLREFVRSGTPDARHLRRADHARPRPPRPARRERAAQRLRPPGRLVRGGPRLRRATPLRAVFIRAPWVEEHGDGVEVLAEVDGHPVAVRQGNILAVAFHPELTDERRLHRWLLDARRRWRREGQRAPRRSPRSSCATRRGCGKGDVCVIQSTTTAEPLVQAVYEEVLRAGGLPIMQLTTEGAQAAFYELASDEQLDWIPPTSEWVAENADVRIAIMADVNSRELSRHRPEEAGARVEGAQAADGDLDAALGGGRVPLGADAVPHARLRERGRHVAARVRGLLLRGLPGDRRRPGHRLAAPVRRGQAPGRVDRGQGGGAHHGARAPTSRSASPAATGSPASASTTCPTASSSPARSRTR